MAAGNYFDTGGNSQGLIETLAAGTWTAAQAPLPANTGTGFPDAVLRSVTCPAAGSCMVTGADLNTTGNTQGLFDTLPGGRWTSAQAPGPADDGTSGASLYSVTCPVAGSCTAVGNYGATDGSLQGLAETLNPP